MVGSTPPVRPVRAAGTALLLLFLASMVSAPVSAGPIEDVGEAVFNVTDCVAYGGCNTPCIDNPDCVGIIVGIIQDTCPGLNCADDAVSTALEAVGDALDTADLYTHDSDGDRYSDYTEALLCGREAVRNQINTANVPGDCDSSTQFRYTPPGAGPYIDIINGVIDDAVGLVDDDGDLVPDALEPTLCSLEDQNTPSDGTCIGNDYTP